MEVHAQPSGPRRRGRPAGITKDYSADQRYQAWKQAYLDGSTYEEIGAEWGVTRQRVEQVMRKLKVVPARQRQRDNMAVIAGTIVRKNLTADEAAEMFGVSRNTVYRCCYEMGVAPPRMSQEEVADFEAMTAEVVGGKSILSAANYRPYRAAKLRAFMLDRGINARGRSRHDDMSERRILIQKWRDNGVSWRECAERLSKHDGRPIGYQGIYQWVRRHMPHLVEAPR